MQATQERAFVDLDPIFNHNLDEDFDFRASGITRTSFCSVYFDWIQFCYEKRVESYKSKHRSDSDAELQKTKSTNRGNPNEQNTDAMFSEPKGSNNQTPSPHVFKSEKPTESQMESTEIVRLSSETPMG